jgi:tetratricopeptide (TPR) repeat protein
MNFTSSFSTRRALCLVSCLALCLTVSTARADDPAAARLHYNEGTKAFDLGLYDKAIAEYMTAYQAVNDPALLYNLAQAHRLGGHVREALRFYRVYLQRRPNAENRPEVEQKIVELKQAADRLEHAQNGLQPDRPLDAGAAAPPPVATTTTVAAAAKPEPPEPIDRPGRTLKIAGLATGAVGVAGLAVGIAFGALAQSASSSLTNTSRNGGFYDPGKYSSGHTDQIVEGVTLGIGAAAVAGGVVLYVLGRRAQLHARPRDLAWLR